jgi:hypothetical protein
MGEVNINIWTLPAAFMLETDLPPDMVDGLNTYLDELLESEERRSHAGTLVGQIHHGQQLTMNEKEPELQEFCKLVNGLGIEYIKHFAKETGNMITGTRKVEVDELWSVHSFESDYNPIHDHGTKTIMGISVTCWTKVPQQILDQPTAGTPNYSLYNSSGACDGYLAFQYGRNSLMDVERLRPPQSTSLQPQVGKLYMFPSWLQHLVYPFKGGGERRTVAANLNVWKIKEGKNGAAAI